MDFNEYVDRRGTNCCKWDDFAGAFPGMDVTDAIPMWVADADLKCPDEVIDTVVERAKQGVYGYATQEAPSVLAAVKGWAKLRYNWEIEEEWIVFTPGVVVALAHAVQSLTDEGDGVIIQQPVYPPFKNVVVKNGRTLLNNELVLDGEDYRMNLEQLEEFAARETTKLMILCNPQNPTGRVWSREEVEQVCEICLRHGVTLVSDEIHADLLMKGTVFTSSGPVAREKGLCSITCYAPSKTFNVAGLQASAIIIPDAQMREKFVQQMEKNAVGELNVFAALALETAWTKCASYPEELMAYVEANMDYAIEFVNQYTPKIKIRKPQGTYLAWVDLRGLGLSDEDAERFFIERAKLAVNRGSAFGQVGAGFVRMNFACHRSTVEKAMEQLRAAYEKEF